MLEYDRNLEDQLDDLPPPEEEEEAQNDGPIEPDELDELIRDALDDDDDDGDHEQDDDDDSSDGGSEFEPSPTQISKKKGRSAQRRAKEAIKRRKLQSELEKTRQEAQQARALADQERSRAHGMEALIKTISGGASMDEILALASASQAPQQNANANINSQEAPLTKSQLEEWYRNKLALNSEILDLQAKYRPIHQRTAKTAPHITSWFDNEFTVGIDANPQRRDLLKSVSDLSYPLEALYAASRKEGFERLSQGEQTALITRCDKKLAERNKAQAQSIKQEPLKTPSSSSVRARIDPEKRSNEDWFNDIYGKKR